MSLTWRKSTKCANTACLEVAELSAKFFVRDSKDSASPILEFDRASWATFLLGVKAEAFLAGRKV